MGHIWDKITFRHENQSCSLGSEGHFDTHISQFRYSERPCKHDGKDDKYEFLDGTIKFNDEYVFLD